nr:hypothetical protein [Tanacetum cinerariifolium]
MPFELCNAPATFQRCVTTIFHDLIEDNMEEKQMFFNNLRHYFWDEPFLFKKCVNQIIRRCVTVNEAAQIIRSVIAVHQEGIMVSLQLQGKSLNLDSTDQIFSAMHANWSELVTRTNEPTTFLQGKRHPKSTSRLEAYESSISYTERTKRRHNKQIKTPTKYEKADKVLLFNSRMRLFPGKLKSRWYGPFEVSKDTENVAIKLYYNDGNEFIVNKQRVKPYQKDALIVDKDEDIIVADEGEVM